MKATSPMQNRRETSVVLFEFMGISTAMTLAQYTILLDYPIWGLVSETLRYTRSYEDGLRAAQSLLELTERFRDDIGEERYVKNLISVYHLALDMLDRLDRWTDYLALWTDLRDRTDLVITVSGSFAGVRQEWVVGEDSAGLHLHFLWGSTARKELIEKKLEKLRIGGKVGNITHGRHAELSDDEVRQRYEFMLRKANYVQKIDALTKSLSNRG